jgi:hypothetical protein
VFSWTAALCLDVVLEDRTSENNLPPTLDE